MLNLLPIEDLARLRGLFQEAGYTEDNLRTYLGMAELPARKMRNEPRLLDRTRGGTLLDLLLRWFWLGKAQSSVEASRVTPAWLVPMLLDSGLLTQEAGDSLTPTAMVLPCGSFLVAADHPAAIERGESGMVLWPNPTSKFLARFAITRRSRATLDLGTGSGILSLGAAAFSDSLVATDLNPRARPFALFNARLNGLEGLEVLIGDGFSPVSGRKFDLILSNPPFFITPKSDYMFCDNPMDLDYLCRKFAQEGPAHLNEGGYMEMLCEWAEVKGQPWQERVAEWMQGNGCDAWVMKGLTQDPTEYAQQRMRETMQESSADAEVFQGYMSYYRDRGVEAIHDGVIVMRRRTGANWIRIEEVPKTPSGNLGEMVLSTFEANDLLREVESDEKLLAIKPRLSPHVRLEQVAEQKGDHWEAESLTLRLVHGFPFHLSVQPLVAEFLATCDGSRDAETAIRQFATVANAPLETVRTECLSMLRRLIDRGFILAARDGVTDGMTHGTTAEATVEAIAGSSVLQ